MLFHEKLRLKFKKQRIKRFGSKYVNKNNPDIVLSIKEWRALPKEERDNYTKHAASKDYVERVSYAKVWGETRKAKSELFLATTY